MSVPLSRLVPRRRGRRTKAPAQGRQAAPPTCRVGGCSSPASGGEGPDGELCLAHLQMIEALRQKLAAEPKARRRA